MVINVHFTTEAGKKVVGQLKDDFTYMDFINMVNDKLGSNTHMHYTLVAKGKELCADDEAKFNERKKCITNSVNVFVGRRMLGDLFAHKTMIFIIFKQPNNGIGHFTMLPNNFTLNDFRKACPEMGDLNNCRLLIDNKQLCLDNENIFNRQKALIQNGTEILILPRAPGGTFIEISLLKEILLEELKTELTKLNRVKKECSICMCEELCVPIHCISICQDCFPNYLQETNFRLRCIQEKEDEELRRLTHFQKAPKTHPCGQEIDYRGLFKTDDFIDKWSVLCDVMEMIANIDCQICYCGALLFNMTMYSKQQCTNCNRWLCFFCNKTWDDQCMVNKLNTCENTDCEYQRRLTYELVPLEGSSNTMIPNRRCCPKCFNVGGYGEKCKYHCCPHCKHEFCFLCLKPKNKCSKKCFVNTLSVCSLAKQDYSIFPRTCDSS